MNRSKRLLIGNQVEVGKYIVIVPGSARRYKCWPVERFAKLADKLTEQYGFSIVVVGSHLKK